MIRVPLGLWIILTVDERQAMHAKGNFYLDVTDLSQGDVKDTQDLAEHLEELGMTHADYRAWTQPKQTQGRYE